MNPRPTVPGPAVRAAALLAALVVVGLLPGGCMIVNDQRALALQAATSGYQSALRWGYYETAYGFVDPELRTGKPLPDLYQGLRVGGYDVVQPPAIGADGKATQIVTVDYLFNDRQVMKQLTDRQVWRYDRSVGSWWLVSGLPAFAQ